MKKITKIAAVAVLVLGVAAMLQPANATCASARLFGTGDSYIYTPGCGYAECATKGGNTSMTDDATGVFWAIGSGDAEVGPGNDNGSFAFEGWSGFEPGYPTFVDSNWAAPGGIDNCIDSSADRCMAMLIMDNNPDTGVGAFALLTDEPDSLGNYNFDQGGPINLVDLSSLSITGSVRIEGGVDVSVDGVSLTDVGAGLYLDPNCVQPSGGGIALIQGYQVYVAVVDRGAGAPSNDIANWTPAGPLTALGDPATLRALCMGDKDVWITVGIVFDSGFGTVLLSGTATKVECGTNLAEPDDEIQRKPATTRERPRTRSRGR